MSYYRKLLFAATLGVAAATGFNSANGVKFDELINYKEKTIVDDRLGYPVYQVYETLALLRMQISQTGEMPDNALQALDSLWNTEIKELTTKMEEAEKNVNLNNEQKKFLRDTCEKVISLFHEIDEWFKTSPNKNKEQLMNEIDGLIKQLNAILGFYGNEVYQDVENRFADQDVIRNRIADILFGKKYNNPEMEKMLKEDKKLKELQEKERQEKQKIELENQRKLERKVKREKELNEIKEKYQLLRDALNAFAKFNEKIFGINVGILNDKKLQKNESSMKIAIEMHELEFTSVFKNHLKKLNIKLEKNPEDITFDEIYNWCKQMHEICGSDAVLSNIKTALKNSYDRFNSNVKGDTYSDQHEFLQFVYLLVRQLYEQDKANQGTLEVVSTLLGYLSYLDKDDNNEEHPYCSMGCYARLVQVCVQIAGHIVNTESKRLDAEERNEIQIFELENELRDNRVLVFDNNDIQNNGNILNNNKIEKEIEIKKINDDENIIKMEKDDKIKKIDIKKNEDDNNFLKIKIEKKKDEKKDNEIIKIEKKKNVPQVSPVAFTGFVEGMAPFIITEPEDEQQFTYGLSNNIINKIKLIKKMSREEAENQGYVRIWDILNEAGLIQKK